MTEPFWKQAVELMKKTFRSMLKPNLISFQPVHPFTQVAGLIWDWTGSNPATSRNRVKISAWKKKERSSSQEESPGGKDRKPKQLRFEDVACSISLLCLGKHDGTKAEDVPCGRLVES